MLVIVINIISELISVKICLVPLVVEMCAKLIEKCGITNGVYRHSGMSTNVQKIR